MVQQYLSCIRDLIDVESFYAKWAANYIYFSLPFTTYMNKSNITSKIRRRTFGPALQQILFE